MYNALIFKCAKKIELQIVVIYENELIISAEIKGKGKTIVIGRNCKGNWIVLIKNL